MIVLGTVAGTSTSLNKYLFAEPSCRNRRMTPAVTAPVAISRMVSTRLPSPLPPGTTLTSVPVPSRLGFAAESVAAHGSGVATKVGPGMRRFLVEGYVCYSGLILRSARRARLEGWFEKTRCARLLTMRGWCLLLSTQTQVAHRARFAATPAVSAATWARTKASVACGLPPSVAPACRTRRLLLMSGDTPPPPPGRRSP